MKIGSIGLVCSALRFVRHRNLHVNYELSYITGEIGNLHTASKSFTLTFDKSSAKYTGVKGTVPILKKIPSRVRFLILGICT